MPCLNLAKYVRNLGRKVLHSSSIVPRVVSIRGFPIKGQQSIQVLLGWLGFLFAPRENPGRCHLSETSKKRWYSNRTDWAMFRAQDSRVSWKGSTYNNMIILLRVFIFCCWAVRWKSNDAIFPRDIIETLGFHPKTCRVWRQNKTKTGMVGCQQSNSKGTEDIYVVSEQPSAGRQYR